MARTTTIDSDEILRVARVLFLKRGLDVPTSEIAKQVGVSEGSIFKRFPTKRALFIASMGIDDSPDWMTTLSDKVGRGALKDNLLELCFQMIDHVRALLPRMMLLWSCRESNFPGEHAQSKTHPGRVLLAHLTDYLDQEMRLGRMRAAHPEVVSRMLMGSIWNYVFLETMGRQATARGELDLPPLSNGAPQRAPSERLDSSPNGEPDGEPVDEPIDEIDAFPGAPSMDPKTYAHSLIETLWSGVGPYPHSQRGED